MTEPCNRCATEYTLRGRSKHQAQRDGDMLPTHAHEPADCIRHLAEVINITLLKRETP